jgi:hypothetical protein
MTSRNSLNPWFLTVLQPVSVQLLIVLVRVERGAVSPKTIAFSQRKRYRHPRTMPVYVPLGASDSPDPGFGANDHRP